MKQTIFFDLGNVLLFFDHQRGARQMAEVSGISTSLVWEQVFASDLLARYERGAVNSTQFHAEYCQRTNSQPSQAALELALSDIFVPNLELWPVVTALWNAGYSLGILSNTCPAHWEFVQRLYPGILTGLFRWYSLSYELQAMKPERAAFDQTAELAGVSPAQIFYCDDIVGHIAGAQAANWDAVMFTDVPQYVRELRSRGIAFNY